MSGKEAAEVSQPNAIERATSKGSLADVKAAIDDLAGWSKSLMAIGAFVTALITGIVWAASYTVQPWAWVAIGLLPNLLTLAFLMRSERQRKRLQAERGEVEALHEKIGDELAKLKAVNNELETRNEGLRCANDEVARDRIDAQGRISELEGTLSRTKQQLGAPRRSPQIRPVVDS